MNEFTSVLTLNVPCSIYLQLYGASGMHEDFPIWFKSHVSLITKNHPILTTFLNAQTQ